MSASPQLDPKLEGNRGPEILIVNVIFLIISTIAVALRVFTRTRVISNIGPEDYLIVVSWLACIVETVFQLLEVKYGAGRHMAALAPSDSALQLKYLYLSIIFYGTTLGLVKSALVIQYIRIFFHRRTLITCYLLLVFIVFWSLGTVVAATFTCWPIEAFWTTTITGARCINKTGLWFSHAGLSIFTDFAILLTPIPALMTLKLPMRQKLAIMVIFGIGSFACITSILRLYYLNIVTRSKDVSWDNSGGIIWSSIETNMFIVCACLTGLRPLITRSKGFGSDRRSSSGPPINVKRPVQSVNPIMLSDQDTLHTDNFEHSILDKRNSQIQAIDVESIGAEGHLSGRQTSHGESMEGPRKSISSDRLLIQSNV